MGATHTYRYIQVPAKPSITETILWTNTTASATSDTTFAKTVATLSTAFTNYNSIRVHYRPSWTLNGTDFYIDVPKADILASHSYHASGNRPEFMVCYMGNSFYGRRFYRDEKDTTNKSIQFENCVKYWDEGGTYNKVCVPLKIGGLS